MQTMAWQGIIVRSYHFLPVALPVLHADGHGLQGRSGGKSFGKRLGVRTTLPERAPYLWFAGRRFLPRGEEREDSAYDKWIDRRRRNCFCGLGRQRHAMVAKILIR